MGKLSKRGPDWTDNLMMLQALEAMHGVTIHVEMRPLVGAITTVWAVELQAVSDQAAPGEAPKRYTWSRQAGATAMEDLSAVLFNGFYELEKKLTRGQWAQMEMPEA